MLEEPDHERRFDYLIHHIASGAGAVIAWWRDELLPLKRNGAWCLDLWPTEAVARQAIPDRYADAEYSRADMTKFLDDVLPDLAANEEVIGGFPNRDLECATWYPDAMKTRLGEAAEEHRLFRALAYCTITDIEKSLLYRKFAPRLQADTATRRRLIARRREGG
ncbi:MAG: DUF2750 domain-containing protein [Pseudomonadota bacterium]